QRGGAGDLPPAPQDRHRQRAADPHHSRCRLRGPPGHLMTRLTAAWRRLRLGTQLALALGALALVVFGLVGAVTTSLLHQYLDTRLGEQLSTTLNQYKVTGFVTVSPG